MLSRLALCLALVSLGAAEPCTDESCMADEISFIQKPVERKPLLIQGKASMKRESVDGTAVMAEGLAMTLFVMIGCGSAMVLAGEAGWRLQVSLVFGLAITTLAYTIGHFSGAQINVAVTFALCISNNLSWEQGACNFVGQLIGSILGAVLINMIVGEKRDKTSGLGCNAVNRKIVNDKGEEQDLPENEHGRVVTGALIGEFAMTFLLCFVVLQVATNPATAANAVNAPIAIGFAVFLAHCLLIPIDGCSINPTRSFGPAVVRKIAYSSKNQAQYSDHWIFWVGPLAGAAAAAGMDSWFAAS